MNRNIISENQTERIIFRFEDSARRYAGLLRGHYWKHVFRDGETYYIVEYQNSGELAKFISENALSYFGDSAFVAFSSEIPLAEIKIDSCDYEDEFDFVLLSNIKGIIKKLKDIFGIDFTYNIIKKSVVFCVDLDVVDTEDFVKIFNLIKVNGTDYIKTAVLKIINLMIVEREMKVGVGNMGL